MHRILGNVVWDSTVQNETNIHVFLKKKRHVSRVQTRHVNPHYSWIYLFIYLIYGRRIFNVHYLVNHVGWFSKDRDRGQEGDTGQTDTHKMNGVCVESESRILDIFGDLKCRLDTFLGPSRESVLEKQDIRSR